MGKAKQRLVLWVTEQRWWTILLKRSNNTITSASYMCTTNELHLPEKGSLRCYIESPTAQDAFWRVPGLISCVGGCGKRVYPRVYPFKLQVAFWVHHTAPWFCISRKGGTGGGVWGHPQGDVHVVLAMLRRTMKALAWSRCTL